MPKRLNRPQRFIDDEILKARIRELTGSPTPKTKVERLTTNPLASIVIGFILTGIVGTCLTYFFSERQKEAESLRLANQKVMDEQRAKEARELETLKSQQAQELEYTRKLTLLEVEAQQHLNEQELEHQRTKELRDVEARRASRQKDLEYVRSQLNVIEQRKIEHVKLLDIFVKYIGSEDPLSREFGYKMFVSLGYEDLAVNLIAKQGDPAGRSVLVGIRNGAGSNENIRNAADDGLAKITETQAERIENVISVFIKGRPGEPVADLSVYYGPRNNAFRILEQYRLLPEARYKSQLTEELMARIRKGSFDLGEDQQFQEFIKLANTDPALKLIRKNFSRDHYLKPALRFCDSLGVKTMLGIAVIYNALLIHGPGTSLFQKTQERLNGTPLTGVDEKVWVTTLVEVQRDYIRSYKGRGTPELFQKTHLPKCDFFLSQIEKNNWDLLPPFQIRDITVE